MMEWSIVVGRWSVTVGPHPRTGVPRVALGGPQPECNALGWPDAAVYLAPGEVEALAAVLAAAARRLEDVLATWAPPEGVCARCGARRYVREIVWPQERAGEQRGCPVCGPDPEAPPAATRGC